MLNKELENNASANKALEAFILARTAAGRVVFGEQVQALWSGYGEIRRVYLTGADYSSAIIKQVVFPSQYRHPRGWNNDFSHQRKLHSYQVEMAWYQYWAGQCDESCRVPRCYGLQQTEQGMWLLLEDLDAAGWDLRYEQLGIVQVQQCLRWLAAFHGRFLLQAPTHLWPIGSYWHLQTRPDEWRSMADQPLKNAATDIDKQLNRARFQTVIHGDAKVANFCFSATHDCVAAVDFQYIGGGCGMKDVAYLLGSCLSSQAIDEHQYALLDYYFDALRQSCAPSINWQALETEWRELYCFAWADFHRFLLGWMPDHHKINASMKRLSQCALTKIGRV